MTAEAEYPTSDTQPLEGLTVLDASRVLVGPFCTMQLGDLGAEVIKVEQPGTGDQTRSWYPPVYGDSDESSYYVSVNRNKRSVTLNLATEEGREVFRRLAEDADVLVENFRVGKMEEWGLGHDTLRERNPSLIYCSLSGYGEWGPDMDRPAYDIIIQAESGLMSITGEEDGAPVRVGMAIADIGGGMYATQAILAALFYRERDEKSRGQKIDVSLLDGQVAWMTYMASNYFATGSPPGRLGSKHPTVVPYQAFETKDGYVVIAVPSQHIWPRFCTAIERPDLIDDERFADNAARVEHREELEPLLEAEIGRYETDELLQVMGEHDVPASRVKDLEDVFDSQQVRERNMHRRVEHPTIGEVRMPSSPMHFSRTPAEIDRHPPLLGEHTDEILLEAGYTEDEIRSFRANDVV